jgi:hypothetical protein
MEKHRGSSTDIPANQSETEVLTEMKSKCSVANAALLLRHLEHPQTIRGDVETDRAT